MRRICAIVLLLVLAQTPAEGATITVMKDGSGDFTLLQPAADSAAPGDTILIGPGRWEEVTEFYFNSGVRRDAHLVVRVDNLTIMGTSNEDVVIGPTVLNDLGGYPVGIVISESIATTRIELLRVAQLRSGIYGLGDLFIESCVADSCMVGFYAVGSIDIRQSSAEDCSEDGIFVSSLAGTSAIDGCLLNNCAYGITLNRPRDRCDISGTTIEGGRVGIQFDQASGTLRTCELQGVQIVGVAISTGSSVEMTDCYLDDNERHINFTNSTLTGLRNRLGNFGLYGIWIETPGELLWNNNDFLYSSPYQVYVSGHFFQDPPHYDFTGNYWGTADAGIIADNIYDLNDDINVRAIIDFNPFAEQPVPAQSSSIGELKSQFRRH
jgi:nitrous oxidase accessory protein NosD